MNIICPVKIITKYHNSKNILTKNIDKNIVKNNNYELNNYFHDHDDHENDIIFCYKICIGTLISYQENYYVITCYHGIQNYECINMCIKLDNEFRIIFMKEFFSLKPYDFSVLTFCDTEDIFLIKKYKYQESIIPFVFDSEIFKIENDLKINVLPNEEFENSDFMTDLNTEYIKCENIGYNISKIKSELYPPIPIIEIKINNYTNQLNYNGLSGSLIYDFHNNIYGMISYYDTDSNNLCSISPYCLQHFLIMSLSKQDIRSFCLCTKICSFNDDKNVGHIINNGYNISYKYSKSHNMRFKKNDIIQSVDDILFDENGNLYFKKMNIYVPLDTYFILKNKKKYKFNYYTKSNNNYIQITRNIYSIPLEKYIKFNLEHNYKLINYKGLIITEMSEELLNYYDNLDIKISGLIEDYYNNCYTFENKKIIIIINIEYDNISQDLSKVYKKIGLPLIKDIDDKYNIPIITKVNKIKINNLVDIEKEIKKSKLFFNIKFTQKNSIILYYDDTNVRLIK